MRQNLIVQNIDLVVIYYNFSFLFCGISDYNHINGKIYNSLYHVSFCHPEDFFTIEYRNWKSTHYSEPYEALIYIYRTVIK